jgi:uncharacterized membrane protein YsdA (DUF1294 family)
MSFLIAIALALLPGYAAHRLGVNYAWVGAYAMAIGTVAYWVYAVDKRRAEEGLWRIPETQLHLLELLGGWPGAFIAQRRLRHKCSKLSYQAMFWLIVLAYQFAAFDSLQSWRYSRAVLNSIQRAADRR